MMLWANVSDGVCMAGAHLLCCALGVLGVRMVVIGPYLYHRRCHWAEVVIC